MVGGVCEDTNTGNFSFSIVCVPTNNCTGEKMPPQQQHPTGVCEDTNTGNFSFSIVCVPTNNCTGEKKCILSNSTLLVFVGTQTLVVFLFLLFVSPQTTA